MTISHSAPDDPRGTIEVGTDAIPWVDLRQWGVIAPLETKIAHLVRELPPTRRGAYGLRLIVLAAPQSSDALALALARDGVHLIVGPATQAVAALLERFERRWRQLIGTVSTTDPNFGKSSAETDSCASSRSAAVFAQRPPWFDQVAFDERIRSLQQPWCEQDAWKSES